MARLFIALQPDARTASDLHALCHASTQDKRARAVSPDRLHMTLHFLGNVPRERVPELLVALQVPFEPFQLSFSRCVRWPAGLVVARPDAVPRQLVHLHAALAEALRRLGLAGEDEAAFRPHVTLARRHSGPLNAVTGDPQSAPPAAPWTVSGYALVESEGGAGGAYRVLRAYP